MDKIAVKYNTTCSDKKSGSVLIKKVFEANSKDEAETRAFLHCVKAGNGLDKVVIQAERI
ncbi:MAG TPA: hypothetical protein PKN50_15130 [Spirochaetota bacterium]|jgi:hypothetical protein|nr:hypothetical protein [Spirochaetota bacterium]HPV42822.1 hypothetical protein [Spirochaetota bacterium]